MPLFSPHINVKIQKKQIFYIHPPAFIINDRKSTKGYIFYRNSSKNKSIVILYFHEREPFIVNFLMIRCKIEFKMGWVFLFLVLSLLCPLRDVGAIPPRMDTIESQQRPIFGDYGGELRESKRRADGIHHVDTPRLIAKLKELKVNTYYFLVWHEASDWDDLCQEFLPAAAKAKIDVWVYLVPPSEAKINLPEPFGTDYLAWFRAIGKLSRHFPHLKGIVIDDFNDNLSFFTPAYLQQMRLAGRKENPHLQFYPQVYYPTINHTFINNLRPFIDGIVLAFRDDPYRNTQRIDRLIQQINEVQSILHQHRLSFVLMIYASRLSATTANPSPTYMEGVFKIAVERLMLKQIQGLITYVLTKQFEQKTDDHYAYSGMGYANFFPSGWKQGKVNDFVQLSQTVPVDPTGPYSLSFVHFDTYPSAPLASPFVQQMWIDRQLVWENKSKQGKRSNRWEHLFLDLTPYLQGKKSAVLTFRLSRFRSTPAHWMFSGIDQLQPHGFRIKNADFEEKKEWTVKANCANLLAGIHMYDPNGHQKTFNTVRKHFNAFHLYQQVHQATARPYLIKVSQRMVTSLLLNQYATTLETIQEMTQLIQADKNIPTDRKQPLLKECRQFHRWIKTKMQKEGYSM
jgi:hypothetical protein